MQKKAKQQMKAAAEPYAVAGIENLIIGHVIRTHIPTVRESDIPTLYWRDCMVIGFEGQPKQDRVTGLYVARFAYARRKLKAEFGYVVDSGDFRMAGVLGLKNTFVVRTNRIDLLPIDPFYLGDKVDVAGLVNNRRTIEEIGNAIYTGMASGSGEGSHGPRKRLAGSEVRQNSGANARPIYERFPLGKIVRLSEQLRVVGDDDYDRATYQARLMVEKTRSAAQPAYTV